MVERDPYEVLGIPPGASLEDAKEAYRLMAELFHPDRLQDMRPAVQAEGERRMREATEAIRVITARFGRPLRAPARRPPDESEKDDLAGAATRVTVHSSSVTEARMYDAALRGVEGPPFHVHWGGRHAASALVALRSAHRVDQGPVRQIEWGAYQVELCGNDMRRFLYELALEGPWLQEPATVVALGEELSGRLFGGPRPPTPHPAVSLYRVVDLLDADCRYTLLVDVY